MIIKPPQKYPLPRDNKSWIFLGGSIEMNTAVNWQEKAQIELGAKYNIMNPRRDNWDIAWEQTFEAPHFSQQVNWELDMIDRAEFVILHFEPETKSPITLLELGYVAGKLKHQTGAYVEYNPRVFVSCPKGFWRKGNVDIICDRVGIPVFETLDEIISYLNKNKPKDENIAYFAQ